MASASGTSGQRMMDVIDSLAVKLYEPPLSGLRERIQSLPESVRTLILIIDFDTEVAMNGITGFLENSTGRYLDETILAFDRIRAAPTANLLRRIRQTMIEHGFTPARMREDLGKREPYEIASFAEVHGRQATAMVAAISGIADELYVGNPHSEERVFELLCDYLEPRRTELMEALSAA